MVNIGILFLIFCFTIIVFVALFGLLRKLRLTPISDWCKHYAIFWNDNGVYVGSKKIDFKENIFSYGKRSYNFKPDESSFFKIGAFFRAKKIYQYNINNPDPIRLNKMPTPIMDAKVFQAIHENDLVIQLNALANGGFWEFIKSYWWLIILGLIIIIYFASGHSFLTPAVKPVVNSTVNAIVYNGGTTG
jgi:hypothetical protein